MNTTFDYLIIGGGSAGCVLAARLSENPSVTVALLEAGGVDSSVMIHCPAGLVMLAQNGAANWKFQTTPQAGLNGRRGYQPRGKVLGGSSSVNAMIYARGHAQDYDGWARAVGEDPSRSRWGWSHALQSFKAFEHNENFASDTAYHGAGGELNVKNLTTPNPFTSRFLQAGVEAGYTFERDFNGEWMTSNREVVGPFQVTHKNGERFSAAKAFLTPNLSRPNLTVITNAQVTKIVLQANTDVAFEALSSGKYRATGVEFIRNGALQTCHAKREVLLSAGAIQSPQILQLSGIGAGADLQSVGIETLIDLPGVGENLHDHVDVVQVHAAPKAVDTFGLSLPFIPRAIKGIFEWRKHRTGMMTTNFAEGGGFIKSRGDVPHPDLQLHFVIGKLINHGRTPTLGHGFSSHVCLLRPDSRGSVKLASPNITDAPLIDPAFLAKESDMQRMIEGFKHMRRILQAPALAGYKGKELMSVEAKTDGQIEDFIRNHADTIYHPVGSCKMGAANDSMAVVGSDLKVRGVAGLRVVDASIMPTIVSGNTNAPTMMIAQVAAGLIAG
ncbi:MAG: hypothetical protein RLY82_675 [Pseudomonadota bacterium]